MRTTLKSQSRSPAGSSSEWHLKCHSESQINIYHRWKRVKTIIPPGFKSWRVGMVVAALRLMHKPCSFCFWIETLKVKFIYLSREEQEPSLTKCNEMIPIQSKCHSNLSLTFRSQSYLRMVDSAHCEIGISGGNSRFFFQLQMLL